MKILVIGDLANKELYHLMELMETQGLKIHTYGVHSHTEGQLSQTDIMPDEQITMIESESVLNSTIGNKNRFTTKWNLEKSDVIAITVDQLAETAKLLPDESFSLIMVMEQDTDNIPIKELSASDIHIHNVFSTIPKSLPEDMCISEAYKYSRTAIDTEKLAEYVKSQMDAHNNLREIIWQLIEEGNIEFAGDCDVTGKPLRHSEKAKVVQYMTNGTKKMVPIDQFTTTVMLDDQALATSMRIWLSRNNISNIAANTKQLTEENNNPEDN